MKGSWTLFKLAYRNNKAIRGFLILVILLEIISVTSLYFLNDIKGSLWRGVQAYDTATITEALIKFTLIALGLVVVNGQLGYVMTRLGFAIRSGLTRYVLSQQDKYNSVSQLPQRVQEDLRYYGDLLIEVWGAIFRAVIKLPLFVGVVVSLTHWYLGVVVVVFVIGGTVATRVLGKKLIPLQAEQETNEAMFRQSIAETKSPKYFFQRVTDQFLDIAKQTKKLSYLQSGLGQGFVLLPLMMLLPLYMSKNLDLGSLKQSADALGYIIGSLTILIDNRQLIVQLESILLRLKWLGAK